MDKKEAEKLALLLTQTYEKIATLKNAADLDPEIKAILAAPLCRLTKMIIPNVHTKIDEIIYAADNELEVNNAPHGHDLVDKDGKHIERKVSVFNPKTKRCNFNWNIPEAQSVEYRQILLHKSIVEKVKDGGYASLEVTDELGRTMVEFKLGANFLSQYFVNLPIGRSRVHNMGCERCDKCNKFHRLEHMQELSNYADKNPKAILLWKDLHKRIAAQC